MLRNKYVIIHQDQALKSTYVLHPPTSLPLVRCPSCNTRQKITKLLLMTVILMKNVIRIKIPDRVCARWLMLFISTQAVRDVPMIQRGDVHIGYLIIITSCKYTKLPFSCTNFIAVILNKQSLFLISCPNFIALFHFFHENFLFKCASCICFPQTGI